MKEKNSTYEKLQGLPFKSASDLKKAESEIDLKVWKALTQAKAIREMLSREEFSFLRDEFKAGFTCSYGNEEKDLIKIYSSGQGIKIHINPEAAAAFENQEKLRLIIKTLSEAFANSYYGALGILPAGFESEKEIKSPLK